MTDQPGAELHAGWLRAHADILDESGALDTGGPGDGAMAQQMRMAAAALDQLAAERDALLLYIQQLQATVVRRAMLDAGQIPDQRARVGTGVAP